MISLIYIAIGVVVMHMEAFLQPPILVLMESFSYKMIVTRNFLLNKSEFMRA